MDQVSVREKKKTRKKCEENKTLKVKPNHMSVWGTWGNNHSRCMRGVKCICLTYASVCFATGLTD